jgi:hypothetical protein
MEGHSQPKTLTGFFKKVEKIFVVGQISMNPLHLSPSNLVLKKCSILSNNKEHELCFSLEAFWRKI